LHTNTQFLDASYKKIEDIFSQAHHYLLFAMLTKRLYRLDEVRAAFLYSLKCGRRKECLFWLKELEDSCYGGEARRLLLLFWCMRIGLSRLAWLETWAKESGSREGRYKVCIQAIQCKDRDSSIWWLLWSVVLVNYKPNPEAPGKLFTLWLTSWKKEGEEFWQPLVDLSNDEHIDTILCSLQEDMKKYSLFAKAAAVTIIYGYKHVQKSSWIPCLDSSYDEEMEYTETIKVQRLYTIPHDCLYGMSARGVGFSTTEELYQLGKSDFQSSPSWRSLYPEEESDETIEAFWDSYFPWLKGDRPDEWPLEEQEKSHGLCLPSGPLSRWWFNWVCNERRFLWGSVQYHVLEWVLKQRMFPIPVLDKLLELYKEFSYTGHICNYPVKKEFVLMDKEHLV